MDAILVSEKWYVCAQTARADEQPHVLKHDDTFMLLDRYGDIRSLGLGEQGLYHEDTRYLSQLELLIDDVRPMFLGSAIKEDNSLLIVELMNPDLPRHGVVKGTVHIFRAKLLWQGACHEHLRLTNHGDTPARLRLTLRFGADFADLFEVRGARRARRGEPLPAQCSTAEVVLGYRGLDGRTRRTRVRLDPAPAALTGHEAAWDLELAAKEEVHLYLTVGCEQDEAPRPLPAYPVAYRDNAEARQAALQQQCSLESSNPLVNLWFKRSAADLAMLTTALPTGPYPYAGVPWYSTTFGRDGILTARELLWMHPGLARGVLAFLAATQATAEDPDRDAEPGKILHEARGCEMARTREVPFARYYGSVDATPLFVALAGAYHERTGDLDFIRSIWSQLKLALDWIDRYGDRDGDGFVEYARRSPDGLVQQGWKDSSDSVFHADGRPAEAPIALCEVQGYVYEARLRGAMLARLMGEDTLARRLRDEAGRLQERFQQQFWCEELGVYALALDGRKQPCRIATSNAGHTLWCGIASPAHAQRMIERFLQGDFHSGWGIRTVAQGQPRYNPMSYHNGSIWPHDNALVAAGMARYGYTEAALRVMSGLFEASLYFDHHRLPELFCGFPRRPSEGPTRYPVACSPQAWASAAVFSMVQSCLGLGIDAGRREVSFRNPRLPRFIDWLHIRDLAVGEAVVDLLIKRYDNNVGIEVTRRTGEVAVRLSI